MNPYTKRRCKKCRCLFDRYKIPPCNRDARICKPCRAEGRKKISKPTTEQLTEGLKSSLYHKTMKKHSNNERLRIEKYKTTWEQNRALMTCKIASFFEVMPETKANLKTLASVFNISLRTVSRHVNNRELKRKVY